MRAVGAGGRAVGTAMLFVLALVGGLLLHLNRPAVRRTVVARVNQGLASVLQGRITIDRIDELGTGHVAGVDAHVDDPSGHTVLRATGVAGRIATEDLLRSLLGGRETLVGLSDISIASVEVSLDTDETGALRLARAFTPVPSTAPPTPPSPGGGVRLSIPGTKLAHVELRGRPGGAPPLDVDVDELDASLDVVPGHVVVELAHAQIVGRSLVPGAKDAGARGALVGRLELPSSSGTGLAASATWQGAVGGVQETLTATYDDGVIVASVDVPPTSPADLATLWPACPFTQPAFAHVELAGALTGLEVRARAGIGPSEIWLAGPASLGADVHANVRFVATSLDARVLSAFAPTTKLSASGVILLVQTADGSAQTVVVLDVPPGEVAAARVPSVAVRAQAQRSAAPASALTAAAAIDVSEPGAPATATVRLVPKGDSFELAFDAVVGVRRLDGIPRLGPIAQGGAQATAQGTLDLGTGHIDARLQASVNGLAAGTAKLKSARITARATGTTSAPRIDAELTGEGLQAGPLQFDVVRAEVHGPPTGAAVKVTLHGLGSDLFARADVGVVGALSVRDLLVKMDRNGESATAQASALHVSSGELGIDDLKVEGIGEPLEATLRSTPGQLTAHARSRGLDLARLARMTGISGLDGRLALDVDATLRRSGARGHVVLDLSQGAVAGWQGATAHVDATLEERRVSGQVTAAVGDVASVDVRAKSLEVGGAGPAVLSAWRTAWGEVDLSAHVDLAKLSARLPKNTLPGSKLAGTIDVKGRVERDSAADDTPDVDVTAKTTGLAVQGALIPWRIDGLGVSVRTVVDGHTGLTSLDVALSDSRGPLVTLAASSDAVPYAAIFTSDQPLLDPLRKMTFQATLTVPPRDIDTLPALLGTRGTHGIVSANLGWTGSADHPRVDLAATMKRAKADVRFLALPLDLALSGRYDGAHGDIDLQASAKGGQVLDASASVDAKAPDLVAGSKAWKASGRATLTRFPLQSLAALDDRQVRGLASGTLTVDGLNDEPKVAVALSLDELRVGEITCKPTTVNVSLDGKTLDATAHIAESDGSADAKVHMGASRGDALLPSPDLQQPMTASFVATSFRPSVLLPFLSTVFTELDGRVDANVKVDMDPGAGTLKPQGTFFLKNGTIELAAMGSELHEVGAAVTLTPDGVIKVDRVSARGLTGRVQAAGSARFSGTRFVGARGSVRVVPKEALPLLIDGTQVGLFDGQIDVAVDPAQAAPARRVEALDAGATDGRAPAPIAPNGTTITVSVPAMRLQLPQDSTHDVQSLGDLQGVRFGVAGKAGEFTPATDDTDDEPAPAGPPSLTTIDVHLGQGVQITRGSNLDVRVEGDLKIAIDGNGVHARGQLRLVQGTLDVEGKTFNIDNGTITFVDDPGNPQIVLTASWISADKTTVFADFVGPLKTGVVTLRSEPAYSKTEILQLILFGTVESQGASGNNAANGSSSDLNAAGGVAGAAATAPVNRAIDHVLGNMGLGGTLGLAAKVDTSQVTPRPEVEVQIAKDISIQMARIIGQPPPGANPDTTLLIVNWRFLRSWTAETTLGNAGTTIVDLLWQHRY